MEKKEKFSLKDHLFHEWKIEYLTTLIAKNYPEFRAQDFFAEIMQDLEKLELKERIIFISDMLEKYLPKDFVVSVEILKKSVPKTPDLSKNDDDFWDFIFAPYGFFVAKNGCSKEYLQYSLESLAYFTQFFSSEWPVRKFFNTFPEETFGFFQKQSKNHNYHIRRWVSEGSRPSLPWGEKIAFDYKKTAILLDELFFDETRYVTRSVANHLNDISKKDPEFVYKILEKWKKSGKQKSSEMEFIIKHALRNLIKSGAQEALDLIGISWNTEVKNIDISLKSWEVLVWEKLEFCFECDSEKDQEILLNYVIYFKTKNGAWKKVFTWFRKKFQKWEKIIFEKNHKFQEMSTRKLYEWEHTIEIYLNGNYIIWEKFELKLK